VKKETRNFTEIEKLYFNCVQYMVHYKNQSNIKIDILTEEARLHIQKCSIIATNICDSFYEFASNHCERKTLINLINALMFYFQLPF
jgi:hypothetical protein